MADRPTFYVDRCLGKTVPTALRAAGAVVEIHDDHFAQDERDEVWIPAVTARGWVILTKDKSIRRRAGEREAVILSNARVITLSSGNMRGPDMANVFVSRLAEIEIFVASQPPPYVAILGQGSIQVRTWSAPPSGGEPAKAEGETKAGEEGS